MKKLSNVVKYFFVTFIFRKILFIILNQFLNLFVQLLLWYLLSVVKLKVHLGAASGLSLRIMILTLIIFHELLHVLTSCSIRVIWASKIVYINIWICVSELLMVVVMCAMDACLGGGGSLSCLAAWLLNHSTSYMSITARGSGNEISWNRLAIIVLKFTRFTRI